MEIEKNQFEEDIKSSSCLEELAIKASLFGCYETERLVPQLVETYLSSNDSAVCDKARGMIDTMDKEYFYSLVSYETAEKIFMCLKKDVQLLQGDIVLKVISLMNRINECDGNFIRNLKDRSGNNLLMILSIWHDIRTRTDCLNKIKSNVSLDNFRFYLEDIFIHGSHYVELFRKLVEFGVDPDEKNNDGVCFNDTLNGFCIDEKPQNAELPVI